MHFLEFLSAGFHLVARHKRLVLVLWLLPLLPALILGGLAASNLAPELGRSLFADRALDGDVLFVFQEFRSSPADALSPILRRGMLLMALVTLLFQVVVSAGVVEVALEHTSRHPFILGVRRNLFPFLRTAGLSAVSTVLVAVLSGVIARGFFKLAEAKGDGRLDVVGVIVAAVFFFALWAPLDLAADLSRIAAARHGQRSMARGFLRALNVVLRRPLTFAPLALSFLVLPLLVHALYTAVRGPWTPATINAVLVLVLAQQSLMILRAALKLSFWGAEVAAYGDLGEPEFCQKREKKHKKETPEDIVAALETEQEDAEGEIATSTAARF